MRDCCSIIQEQRFSRSVHGQNAETSVLSGVRKGFEEMKIGIGATGSTGNIYYLECNNKILLLDAGRPIKEIKHLLVFPKAMYNTK